METAPRAAYSCPPHHWLIQERLHSQHWTCYGCQAEREVPQEIGNGTSPFNRTRRRAAVPDGAIPPTPVLG
jgi:hypothetical protein